MSPLSFEVSVTALAPDGLPVERHTALQALIDRARDAALTVLVTRADAVAGDRPLPSPPHSGGGCRPVE
ncbi:hypothetical protein [Devosia sp.]|jgi:hypothetical protein|uniref:hypothetical protein n=1 Tax=Devosia sp. TaxID=1871048 RepID=UPI0037BFF258